MSARVKYIKQYIHSNTRNGRNKPGNGGHPAQSTVFVKRFAEAQCQSDNTENRGDKRKHNVKEQKDEINCPQVVRTIEFGIPDKYGPA